jgi:hypothetical protein
MKPSIFKGLNISKLPLTHCGSIYLFKEVHLGNTNHQAYQNLIDEIGNTISSLKMMIGSIEKGRNLLYKHLQYCCIAEDIFVEEICSKLVPIKTIPYKNDVLAKIKNPNTISGYQDTIVPVNGITLRYSKFQFSVAPIVNSSCSAQYIFKQNNYGVNDIYYQKSL